MCLFHLLLTNSNRYEEMLVRKKWTLSIFAYKIFIQIVRAYTRIKNCMFKRSVMMNNDVKPVSSSSGLIFNRLVLFSHIILLYNTPPQRSRVMSESISHKYFHSFIAAVVATTMFLIAFSFIYIIIIYVSAAIRIISTAQQS